MAANKAMWVRKAWQGLTSPQRDDIMVGVDGDNIIIQRFHSNEKIVISKRDWAKLFWSVRRAIAEEEHVDEDIDEAAAGG
jgi:hypothetical protein